MSEFDARELRNALGRFATGITVIATLPQEGPAQGLTANSFSAVSLEPALILWCLAKESPALDSFKHCSHFSINVLSAKQRALSNHFATPADDKFAAVDWYQGLAGVPLLPDCLAYFECRHERHHEGGDHLIFIGTVERFSYSDGAPLLFSAGRYGVVEAHPDDHGEVAEAQEFADLLL